MHPPKVFFYVQHLIGIGHVRRSAALTRALIKQGFEVDFVMGGLPVEDIDLAGANLISLPPAHVKGGDFDRLLTKDGHVVDGEWWVERRARLLDAFKHSRANIIITETYPFGRRQFHVELLPLLDATMAMIKRPLVISSIRDILQPKRREGRNEEIRDILNQYYDHVLVHGDSQVATMDDTFPYATGIKGKLYYTGYVTDMDQEIDHDSMVGRDEVIVSAGGGAIGELLLTTAIAARPLSNLKNKVWRILIGPNLDPEVVKKIRRAPASGIIVESNRKDFRELLSNCLVSVSQGGYNTVMDILRANAKSVMVPYVLEREVEQLERVRKLAAVNRVQLIEEKDLTADKLAGAINQSQTEVATEFDRINVEGAEKSAEILKTWMSQSETN